MGIEMKKTFLLTGAALMGALCLPTMAQQPPAGAAAVVAKEPGKVTVAATVKVTGTVQAIDKATREVTLKGPQGNLHTLTAGPDVRNFDQVKVGDQVMVGYVEALSLTLKKGGKELRSKTESTDGARAAAGEKPAGVVGRKVEVTADVTAVNTKTKMITLRGPQQTVELKVEDPEQLKLIKVGDQIQAVYAQAVAVSVDTVAAPAKK
jgi:Cu/Ag efflux protein CusF